MGREIVYCERCGNGLREDDFQKGRASMIGNRPFCAACRPATSRVPAAVPAGPAPAPEPPPTKADPPRRPRKTSTARIPIAGPPGARRAPPAKPARASKAPLIVALVVGGAVVLVLLIIVAASSGRPRSSAAPKPGPAEARVDETEAAMKSPEAPPGDRPDAHLAEIHELIRNDALFTKRPEVLERMEGARRSAGARAGDLDRLRAEYDRDYEDAARRLADFARGEAQRLASQNKLDEAIRKCDDYLGTFGPASAASPIRNLRLNLEKRRNP